MDSKIYVLNELGDFDLQQYCQVDKATNKLCKSLKFLAHRIITWFGPQYLPNEWSENPRNDYRQAKLNFLEDQGLNLNKPKSEHEFKLALLYDYNLPYDVVYHMLLEHPYLYEELDDRMYAKDKKLYSMINHNFDEIERFVNLGFKLDSDDLFYLFQHISISTLGYRISKKEKDEQYSKMIDEYDDVLTLFQKNGITTNKTPFHGEYPLTLNKLKKYGIDLPIDNRFEIMIRDITNRYLNDPTNPLNMM